MEGKEEEKEESTVSPECIDSTVAQFSLPSAPSHLLHWSLSFSCSPRLFTTLSCMLSLSLCLPLTSSRFLFLSPSLFLSRHVVLYEFIGDLVATHPRFYRVTIMWKWFRKSLKLHVKKVLKRLHYAREIHTSLLLSMYLQTTSTQIIEIYCYRIES